MNQKNEDAALLAWAGNKIRQAQENKAYCTITIQVKDGVITKLDRQDSYLPPSAGRLYKQTDG